MRCKIVVALCILLSACAHIPPPDDIGGISVDHVRLSDLAAEFNRRNARQIILDRTAAKLRLNGGYFLTTQPEGLVLVVHRFYPRLSVSETAAGWSVEATD